MNTWLYPKGIGEDTQVSGMIVGNDVPVVTGDLGVGCELFICKIKKRSVQSYINEVPFCCRRDIPYFHSKILKIPLCLCRLLKLGISYSPGGLLVD